MHDLSATQTVFGMHCSTFRACLCLQIEALRKKLRILVDHNANAPDLEKCEPWMCAT